MSEYGFFCCVFIIYHPAFCLYTLPERRISPAGICQSLMIDIAGHTTGEESGTFSALQNYEQIISKNKKRAPIIGIICFKLGYKMFRMALNRLIYNNI